MIVNKKIMFLGLVAGFLVLQKNSYGIGGGSSGGASTFTEPFEEHAKQHTHFHSYNSFSAAPITNDPVSLQKVSEEQINLLQSV
jgi:hypothetical protein